MAAPTSPILRRAADRLGIGICARLDFSEEVDPQAQAWADRYRREYDRDAQLPRPMLAAWEYRAIRGIVAPCLEAVGTDRMRLRDCLRQWRGRLFGVPAEVYFDATGQLVQPPLAVEIRDGAFHLFSAAR